MEENWKKIPGYEPYEVSSLGNVRNEKGFILKTDINWQGYHRIYLTKVRMNAKVHRLVSLAFIPAFKGKSKVNHINGIKTDNRLSNLEWCNDSENMRHAHANGLVKNKRNGAKHHNAALDEYQVKTIKSSLADGFMGANLARYFKVNHATITDIKLGKTWKHVAL